MTSLAREAFVRLDKRIFLLDPESTIQELEELEDYKSLESIIQSEAMDDFPGIKKYYKFLNTKQKMHAGANLNDFSLSGVDLGFNMQFVSILFKK